jgi:hypothetical protein
MREQRLSVFLGGLASCVLALTFLIADARAVSLGQGDANGDGSVDQADLVIVLNNYNQGFLSDAWSHGDFNGDGDVNGADLNVVLSNYNSQTSTSGNVTATVPEPATLLLLVTGLLGLLAYGWRKRR